MAADKATRATARQLLRLSLEDGRLSEARVRDVLAWFEQRPPARAAALLREYHRLVAREVARGHARIEHAGPLAAATVERIVADLARARGRPITAEVRENPALIAGLRVTLGDDVYEQSVAARLEAFAPA